MMRRLLAAVVLVPLLFTACATTGRFTFAAEEKCAATYGVVGSALGAGIGVALAAVGYGTMGKNAVLGGLSGAGAGGYYGYQKCLVEARQQQAYAAAVATAAPRETCVWSYDHNGVYAYRCDGSVTRSHPGPPAAVLPSPPKLTPASGKPSI